MTPDGATAQLIAAAEAAEAELEASDDIAFTGTRTRAKAEDPCQVYSVRIPVDWIDRLRQRADDRGVTVGVLVREWVLARLDVEASTQTTPGDA